MSEQKYTESGLNIWKYLPHYLTPETIAHIFNDVSHYASQNEPDTITNEVIDRIWGDILLDYTEKQDDRFLSIAQLPDFLEEPHDG